MLPMRYNADKSSQRLDAAGSYGQDSDPVIGCVHFRRSGQHAHDLLFKRSQGLAERSMSLAKDVARMQTTTSKRCPACSSKNKLKQSTFGPLATLYMCGKCGQRYFFLRPGMFIALALILLAAAFWFLVIADDVRP
jgi:DNA-directed RNA polymerase subunit RPC12/RpoP